MIEAKVDIIQVVFAITHFKVLVHRLPELQSFFIKDDWFGTFKEIDIETTVKHIHMMAAEMYPVDGPWIGFIGAIAQVFFGSRYQDEFIHLYFVTFILNNKPSFPPK